MSVLYQLAVLGEPSDEQVNELEQICIRANFFRTDFLKKTSAFTM